MTFTMKLQPQKEWVDMAVRTYDPVVKLEAVVKMWEAEPLKLNHWLIVLRRDGFIFQNHLFHTKKEAKEFGDNWVTEKK
jgi:hypothetical protein